MTTKLSLALEYFHPWPNSAGFYVARHRGWYADAGIDLQIRTVDPGIGDGLEHLQRQLVDVAVFPTNRLLVRVDAGQRLVALKAVNQRGLETIRTLQSSGIRTLADLAGRRLALNPTPRGLAMVRELVRRAGGQPDEVILLDVGARELTSEDLAEGVADASFGSYWAWDILLSEHPDRPERVWRVDDELPFGYHSYLLGARAEFAAQHTAVLDEFHAVTERGFHSAAERPEEAVEVLRSVTPYFTDDVLTRSLEAISETWFHDGRWGTIRRELIEPYAHWLAHNEILSSPVRWHDAFLDASSAGAAAAT